MERRSFFFFFGALAGATLLGRRADAQGVRRPRVASPRSQQPDFPTAVVNESVAALPSWSNSRVRLVRRITMGVTLNELNEVNRLGYQEYLNRQLNYTEIDDSAVDDAVAARWPLVGATNATLATSNQGTVT